MNADAPEEGSPRGERQVTPLLGRRQRMAGSLRGWLATGARDLRFEQASVDLGGQLRRIAALAKPYRGPIVLGTVLVLLGTLSGLLFPLIVSEVIDNAIAAGDLRLLHLFSIGLVVLFVLRAIIGAWGSYLLDLTGERLVVDLRTMLFGKILTLDLDFFHGQKVGDLTSRLSSDTAAIRTVVTDTSVSVLNQTFTLVGSVAVMAYMEWRLTLIILLLAPTTTVLSHYFGRVLQNSSKRVRDKLAATSVVLHESLSGIAVVKSHSRADHALGRYRDSLGALLGESLRSIRVGIWFRGAVGLLASFTTVAIFWYGGQQVFAKQMSVGELVAFLFYVQNITQAFSGFAQLYVNLNQAAGASSRAFELLALAPSVRERPGATAPATVEGAVRFEGVHFGHGGEDILSDFNLDIRSGEIVVLAGESGCGKTSAVNLLPRLFDVTSGRVSIDGIDVRDLPLVWLRQQVSIVSQDVFLFGGTIAENIRYGRLDADDEQLRAAATAAEAHEFIVQMEHGYDTEVGERGVRLSGGQRQRLALARTFLRESKILVLDEATSGVDSVTERRIYETVQRWCKRKHVTTLIVAHRSSALGFADRIMMMERGVIVEQGAYADLMSRRGHFHALMAHAEGDVRAGAGDGAAFPA